MPGFSLNRRNTSDNSTDSEKTRRRMSAPGESGAPPMPTAASAPDLLMKTSAPDLSMQPMPTVDERQGLTLVHFSAQPEPFLIQNTP
jgi:hypothetical protein